MKSVEVSEDPLSGGGSTPQEGNEGVVVPPVSISSAAGGGGSGSGSGGGGSDEKVAALNNKLKQTMSIIKTLKASENALHGTVKELGEQLAQKVETLEGQEITIAHLNKTCEGLKNELRKSDTESDVGLELVQKLQSTQMSMQQQSQELEEKCLALKQSKDMYDMASSRIGELEIELKATKQSMKEASRLQSSSTVQKAEMDALLENLRKDLQKALSNNERLENDCKDLQAYKDKTSVEVARYMRDSADGENLKADVENKNVMVVRLQSEAQKAEQNHAMRTAMLAAAEEQITQLTDVVQRKDALIKTAKERGNYLQSKLDSTNNEKIKTERVFEEKMQKIEEEMIALRKTAESELASSMQSKDGELDSLRKEHIRKATMARSLLAEKEAELSALSEKLVTMQEEIDSGGPTERKIFALARAQSQREYTHSLHADTREIAFQSVQEQIARKDMELAEVTMRANALQEEVTDLRRVSRREGVNMDYVKNVILQFMTFPIHAPERQSLVPVIGMLLQFDKKEAEQATKATINPSWEPRLPKEIDSISALARSSHG